MPFAKEERVRKEGKYKKRSKEKVLERSGSCFISSGRRMSIVRRYPGNIYSSL
jgi:hypothetical protein